MCGTEQSKEYEYVQVRKDRKFAKFSRDVKFDSKEFLNSQKKERHTIFQKREMMSFHTTLGKILLNKLDVRKVT